MATEFVTIETSSGLFRDVKSTEVNYSADEASRTFSLSISEVSTSPFSPWPIRPGDAIKLLATGDVVLTGYVERYKPSFKGHESHDVTITGGSKSIDAVDSSADHKTGEFLNKDALAIAKELDKYDVGFKSDIPLKKIERFHINLGETVFEAIDRVAQQQKFLQMGMPDGSILITRGGLGKPHGTALVEGANLLDGSADLDVSNLFQTYKTIGQRASGSGSENTELDSEVIDAGVKRARTKILIPDDETDKDRLKTRGELEKEARQGGSISADVTVQGWRDAQGQIWTANAPIYIFSPTLKLDREMTINSVNLSQSREQGTIASLSLVDKRALHGEGSQAQGGQIETDAIWSIL